MKTLLKRVGAFVKEYVLIFSMVSGAILYKPAHLLVPYVPYVIFVMLFITFCKFSFSNLKIEPSHWRLLAIQSVGATAAYLLLSPFDEVVAQGALVCMLVPTATSAVVITGMLGGSVSYLTVYTLLCNVVVALVAPFLFSHIGVLKEVPFDTSFLIILKKVAPMLVLPLIVAIIMKRTVPKVVEKIVSIHLLSFYLWVGSLAMVTGDTVYYLLNREQPNWYKDLALCAVSMVICVAQFKIGRMIGRRRNDPVSSGQGLGQKNTVLAIWMANTYLNPLSSVAPAAYVVWQNIINSYQLWRKNRAERG